jgi:hypothetical protein
MHSTKYNACSVLSTSFETLKVFRPELSEDEKKYFDLL